MLNKVYSLFGLVLCKKSVLRKEIQNVVKVSQEVVKDNLELKKEELEERVDKFMKDFQIAASRASSPSSVDCKVEFDSGGKLGWSDKFFPKDSYGYQKVIIGGD